MYKTMLNDHLSRGNYIIACQGYNRLRYSWELTESIYCAFIRNKSNL